MLSRLGDTIQLVSFYGSLQPSTDYEVIEEGFDWVRIKNGTYVPLHMIRRPGEKDRYAEYVPQQEEDEYEFAR